jgi:hypothetical protein
MNEYVVVLDDAIPFQSVESLAHQLASRHGVRIEVIWKYALRGFLCNATDDAISALAEESGVKYVDQDVAGTNPAEVTASVVSTTWNGQDLTYLDRLDETTWAARDHTYNMCPTGSGIYAYVIDEAARTDHTALAGRLVLSWDFTSDQSQTYGSATVNDCRSNALLTHGTVIASLLTGRTSAPRKRALSR